MAREVPASTSPCSARSPRPSRRPAQTSRSSSCQPAFSKAAVVEAIDAEIPLAVVITEGIAVHDSAAFYAYAKSKGDKTRIIGPNCPGLITPGQSNAADHPG